LGPLPVLSSFFHDANSAFNYQFVTTGKLPVGSELIWKPPGRKQPDFLKDEKNTTGKEVIKMDIQTQKGNFFYYVEGDTYEL